MPATVASAPKQDNNAKKRKINEVSNVQNNNKLNKSVDNKTGSVRDKSIGKDKQQHGQQQVKKRPVEPEED